MSRWTQFGQILKQPAYRIKLAFFLLLGITAVLVAIRLPPNSLEREILLEFAVTFGAVGVLQLLWDFLGGEPLEVQIENIQQSITVLSDLMDGNIGIERIWPNRQTWESDPKDGLRKWHDRICQAKSVDMMSNTLWENWMQEEKFRRELSNHIRQGAAVVRILIYDPDSEVFHLRAQDETRWPDAMHRAADEMKIEIANTLRSVKEIWDGLPVSTQKNLKVCLTNQALQPAQIIRADGRMLIATYLAGQTGSPSPTMQLRGSESTYFAKHKEQFEVMWKRGRPLSDKDFYRILGKV